MYFKVVLLIFLTIATETFCEICVLEPMVTLEHPKCIEITSCPASNGRYKRSNNDEEKLVYLKPGSPGLGHFGSIAPNNEPSQFQKFVYYKSLFIAEKTGQFCNKDYKYRSYDGKCNNLDNPEWGCADSPMIRFLPPRYAAENQSSTSKDGLNLPLARVLSYKLFKDRDVPAKNETLAVMQWGQLVTHDLSRSAVFFGKPVDCCASQNYQCHPIQVPQDDPFFGQYNVTCFNNIRTRYIIKSINCTDMRYQITAVSQPLDLSQLYGSTIDLVRSLRQFEGGLLGVHVTSNGRVFPELSDDPAKDCNGVYINNTSCFHSTDDRVNQNTQFTCLHTVMLREHNRIATILATLNPFWNDEILFQEARRIFIAAYQHISYKEWLPFILGDEYRRKHNLIPLKTGYTHYRKDINLATINSFTTSAFRLFHSQIQGQIKMYNATRCPFRTLNFSDYMDRPGIIMEDNNFDSLLIGLTAESSQQADKYFTTQVTEMMFHGPLPYGEDLESFDIDKGRDHGLPSYNDFRELCKLKRAQDFSDLKDDIDEESLKILAELYESVDDIDYFVGGTLEKNHETMYCIIGEQFVRKKFGDRFWYEHSDQIYSFSSDQLEEIRKASLSRLLCDNGDNITHMQPNGFIPYSVPGNEVVPCSELPAINLTKWQDTTQPDTL